VKSYSYIIIDDNPESIRETRALASGFPHLAFAGVADNYDDGLNLILEVSPKIVFIEISPEDPQTKLSLKLLNELYRYFTELPEIVVTTGNKDLAFEAIKYDVLDYLIKPISKLEFRKTVLRFDKLCGRTSSPDVPEIPTVMAELTVPAYEASATDDHLTEKFVGTADTHIEDKPLVICVKSYGDYRFINAGDICYLQADNNSTDIHLNNGEMITAFKTLKHFETVLQSPFVRIHNSYIVNIDYVSRIHTGNAVCYIRNTTTKLPFSKSYKENVDAILHSITNGNYLEI
jgi:DNA-binding LytR/AlgR family response regulator